MEKQYVIKTKGRQTENGVSNDIEMVSVGSYECSNGVKTICYEECDGDFAGATTTVVVSGDLVETIRDGDYAVQLTAERGKRHNCYYDTPYGRMVIGVFCKSVKDGLRADGGVLKFSYTMDINSEFLSENEVEITVKEAAN